MALVEEKSVNSVIADMHKGYYEPRNLKDNVIVADAIQGAGIL